MYWFSAPAIVKGWIDRVLTKGFAYAEDKGLFSVWLPLTFFSSWCMFFSNDTNFCAEQASPDRLHHWFPGVDVQGPKHWWQTQVSLSPSAGTSVSQRLSDLARSSLGDLKSNTLTLQSKALSYCGFEILESQDFRAPSCASEEERKMMLENWVKRLQDIKKADPKSLAMPELCPKAGASQIPVNILHKF